MVPPVNLTPEQEYKAGKMLRPGDRDYDPTAVPTQFVAPPPPCAPVALRHRAWGQGPGVLGGPTPQIGSTLALQQRPLPLPGQRQLPPPLHLAAPAASLPAAAAATAAPTAAAVTPAVTPAAKKPKLGFQGSPIRDLMPSYDWYAQVLATKTVPPVA